MWERFSWYGFYSAATIKQDRDEFYEDEYNINTDVNELMNVIESMIIRIHSPKYNKSIGSLKTE